MTAPRKFPTTEWETAAIRIVIVLLALLVLLLLISLNVLLGILLAVSMSHLTQA